MIKGTIKDYTITTLQDIIGLLVIKKGKLLRETKTRSLDLDLHTSQGLHITHIDTTYTINKQGVECPNRSKVTYTTQVHKDPIIKDLKQLTKPNLWELAYILSEI